MCCLGAGWQPWPAASGPGWSVVRRNSSCSLLLPENSEVFPHLSHGFPLMRRGQRVPVQLLIFEDKIFAKISLFPPRSAFFRSFFLKVRSEFPFFPKLPCLCSTWGDLWAEQEALHMRCGTAKPQLGGEMVIAAP